MATIIPLSDDERAEQVVKSVTVARLLAGFLAWKLEIEGESPDLSSLEDLYDELCNLSELMGIEPLEGPFEEGEPTTCQ